VTPKVFQFSVSVIKKENSLFLITVVIQWMYNKNVNKLTILYFIIATDMAPK